VTEHNNDNEHHSESTEEDVLEGAVEHNDETGAAPV